MYLVVEYTANWSTVDKVVLYNMLDFKLGNRMQSSERRPIGGEKICELSGKMREEDHIN